MSILVISLKILNERERERETREKTQKSFQASLVLIKMSAFRTSGAPRNFRMRQLARWFKLLENLLFPLLSDKKRAPRLIRNFVSRLCCVGKHREGYEMQTLSMK